MVSQYRIKEIIRECIHEVLSSDEYNEKLLSKIKSAEDDYADANSTCRQTHNSVNQIKHQQDRLRNWRNKLPLLKQITSQRRYRKLQDGLHSELKDNLNRNSKASIKRDQAMLRKQHLDGFKNNNIKIGNIDEF